VVLTLGVHWKCDGGFICEFVIYGIQVILFYLCCSGDHIF